MGSGAATGTSLSMPISEPPVRRGATLYAYRYVAGTHEGKKGSSFLKKRTKKLLPVRVSDVAAVSGPSNKSFLVLFFKKEHFLPFYALA
jgi:hypothetical protein